ncbi:MAG: hypothetical protein R3327_06035 [Nitrosopumilaceae archaeon]|nr:hypothetical protein [Nitrosopumilaceae archaeon]
MIRILPIIIAVLILGFSVDYAFSQEAKLATFQETAQVVVDKIISQNVTASITLQSTSIQEIQIPQELEKRIRENERVLAVIVTNQENCVLGVFNESCIMINVQRNPDDKGVIAIQESAKEIGNSLIEDINNVFDTSAEFHSVYIHTTEETNDALDTSGVISGRGTISAVYTMPQESTDSMYEKITAILLPKVIRDSGGFYSTAAELAKDKNSRMTVSIIPLDNASLMQIKLSKNYPNVSDSLSRINPLEYLETNQLKRSDYFSSGFYPLNSLVQVVVLSPDTVSVANTGGKILETETIGGEEIPVDISKKGWVFDPISGERIQGKFLFGTESVVNSNELVFTIAGETLQVEEIDSMNFDESSIVVVIIGIAAAAAVIFYMKGYKKQLDK